jgi:hypothetical protein
VTLTDLPHGEERSVSRGELERLLGPVPPGVDEQEYVGAYLRHHGIEATPSGDALVLRRSPRMAVLGAATLTGVCALFAAAGRPLYGLIVIALCGIGIALVALRYDALAARLPRWVPRGRVLGALVVLPFLVVAGAIDVALRQSKVDSDARALAIKDARQANEALDRNDPRVAAILITSAEAVDPGAPGVSEARGRLVTYIENQTKQVQDLKRQVAELESRVGSGR